MSDPGLGKYSLLYNAWELHTQESTPIFAPRFNPVDIADGPPWLTATAIHVWRLFLDDSRQAPTTLLSPQEQRRLARQTQPQLARRFLVSRCRMRQILAAYSGIPAAQLVFAYAPGGKPRLTDSTLQFNLSHSHELGLLAIRLRQPVGIDVERLRPVRTPEKLASRVGCLEEYRQHLARTQAPAAAFLRFWTSMEARQKARGEGIFSSKQGAEDFCWQHFTPAEGYIAAWACPPPAPPTVSFFQLART